MFHFHVGYIIKNAMGSVRVLGPMGMLSGHNECTVVESVPFEVCWSADTERRVTA